MNDAEIFAIVESIAATGVRAEKEDLLASLIATDEGKMLVNWCYNPFITFGVSAPKKIKHGKDGCPAMLKHFAPLLEDLAARRLTGNAARGQVDLMFDTIGKESAELLFRILSKDLKAGVGKGTLMAVAPDLVPFFSVMRAHPYEEKRITEFPVVVEPKLDGFRSSFIARDGGGGFFTRTGAVIQSLDNMVAPMLNQLRTAFAEASKEEIEALFGPDLKFTDGIPEIMIDSEAKGSGDFNKTSGDLRRKSEQTYETVVHMFDCLTWKEFSAVESVDVEYVARRRRVQFLAKSAVKHGNSDRITQTKIRIANSHSEIMDIYAEDRRNGDEGSMVKKPRGGYDKKKTFGWQKIKNSDTEDLEIIGAFPGQPNTKYEHTLGGVVVRRGDVRIRVSAFADEDRDQLWADWQLDLYGSPGRTSPGTFEQDKDATVCISGATEDHVFLGRILEVEFHEVTPAGSLRHPRPVQFRDDKRGEVD